MERYTQKEIAKILIQIRNVMDFLDDGYHNKEYGDLVEISNGVFSRLSEENQKKAQEWYQKKLEEA